MSISQVTIAFETLHNLLDKMAPRKRQSEPQ